MEWKKDEFDQVLENEMEMHSANTLFWCEKLSVGVLELSEEICVE